MFSPLPQHLPSAPRNGDRGENFEVYADIFFINPIQIQLRTVEKCRFRPSGGFVKPKIFLYAPRQPMVALRLDRLVFLALSPQIFFPFRRACKRVVGRCSMTGILSGILVWG